MIDKRPFKKVDLFEQVQGIVVELANSGYMFKLVEYYKNENGIYISSDIAEFSLKPKDFWDQKSFKAALRKEFPAASQYKGPLYVSAEVIRYYKSVQ